MLDLMHQVSMPAAFVWKLQEPLFRLCDDLGCTTVIELALGCYMQCVERDPWRMFSVASERNNIALARAALSALAAAEQKMATAAAALEGMGMNGTHSHMVPMGGMGADMAKAAMMANYNGFPTHAMGGHGMNGMHPMAGMGLMQGGMGHNGVPKSLNGGVGGFMGQHMAAQNGFPTVPGAPGSGKKSKKRLSAGAGELDWASLNMIMSKSGEDKVSCVLLCPPGVCLPPLPLPTRWLDHTSRPPGHPLRSLTLTPGPHRRNAFPRRHDERSHDLGRALGRRDQLGRHRPQLQARPVVQRAHQGPAAAPAAGQGQGQGDARPDRGAGGQVVGCRRALGPCDRKRQ